MQVERGARTTGGRAPRRDAVRNDGLVLEAALAVFGEHGPQAGMEEVADRAGVGVGTVYRRFPSKEALLDALAARIGDEMEAAAREAIADADAERGLTGFLEFVGAYDVAKRRLSPVLIERVGDRGMTPAMSEMVEALTRRAVESGALGAGVTAADLLSLVKALRGVVASSDGDGSWRRFLRIHLAGLRTAD